MSDYDKLLKVLDLINEWQLTLSDEKGDKEYLEKLYALIDKQRKVQINE